MRTWKCTGLKSHPLRAAILAFVLPGRQPEGGQVSLAWASYTIKSTLALPNEDNRNAHRKVLDYPNEILACRLRPSAQSPRSVGTLYWTSIVHGKKASLPHVTAQGPDQDENSWISEEN